jgi:hypothetical protein
MPIEEYLGLIGVPGGEDVKMRHVEACRQAISALRAEFDAAPPD